jgi:hypothetical protein
MDRPKEAIRTAGSTWSAVPRREVVTEDVCPWNMILVQQPADKPRGSGCLWSAKRIGFSADVFDTDRAFVCTHAVIRTVAVADHLVNVAISIDDVMRRDLPAAWLLELLDRTRKRALSSVHDNLVNSCSVAARMVRALNELFDRRLYMRITAAMTGALDAERGLYWYGSTRRNCYPNDIVSV